MACRYGYECNVTFSERPPERIKLEWNTYQSAACALVTYTPGDELKHWLRSLRLAGVQRFYLYYDPRYTSEETLNIIKQAGLEGVCPYFYVDVDVDDMC